MGFQQQFLPPYLLNTTFLMKEYRTIFLLHRLQACRKVYQCNTNGRSVFLYSSRFSRHGPRSIAQALCESVAEGLEGKAESGEFVAHLESAFDPALIRSLLAELRKQIQNPTLRPEARIIEVGKEGVL